MIGYLLFALLVAFVGGMLWVFFDERTRETRRAHVRARRSGPLSIGGTVNLPIARTIWDAPAASRPVSQDSLNVRARRSRRSTAR